MAITTSAPVGEPRAFKFGAMDAQLIQVRANSGATSGSLVATSIARLDHVILPSGFVQSAAPSMSGNTATLAFSVPAETAASKAIGGVTYTAVANLGSSGNNITVAYTGGATAGAEVVTVVGNAISVQIEDGVSTITQVRTAVNAAAAAAALVTATGTSATVVAVASAVALEGGIDGGASGVALCLGRP